MEDQLVIERLEIQAHCGVTEAERLVPQVIAVDLILDYHPGAVSVLSGSDDILKAVDYARVVERVVQTGTARKFNLLETLSDHLIKMLFSEFPIERARLWVRKVGSPLKEVQGSVGVRADRKRDTGAPRSLLIDPPPSRFLVENLDRLPKGTALDVATGSGRNALYLAQHGFSVHALDRDEQALRSLEGDARERNLTNLTVETIDLEADPNRSPELPKNAYDVVLVSLYLYRPLFPSLLLALKTGGVLVYETFLIENHLHFNHPRRKEFCLGPNELLDVTKGLRVLHYEEGQRESSHSGESAFTARLLAKKENSFGLT